MFHEHLKVHFVSSERDFFSFSSLKFAILFYDVFFFFHILAGSPFILMLIMNNYIS